MLGTIAYFYPQFYCQLLLPMNLSSTHLRLAVLVCFLMLLQPLIAQHQYVVIHYNADEYGGGNQNWSVASDTLGRKFVANNDGLMVIDGSGPELQKYPGKTILRSVAVAGQRVYTGSFEAFGYWTETGFGQWNYHPLEQFAVRETFRNEEIWRIVPFRDKVYFQSFGNIFIYDGNSIKRMELPGSVLFLINAGDRLFIQRIKGSLYEIVNDSLQLVPGSEIFANTEIKSVLERSDGALLIGTSTEGLYIKDKNNSIVPWKTDADNLLKTYNLNNGVRIGRHYAFGTILKGIAVIDEQGKLIHHVHTGNGLQNNTVLSLEADARGNLWAGLDKGIDYIWLDAPVEIYRDRDHETGSVYSGAFFDNKYYIGTNQGIYVYKQKEDGFLHRTGFLEGSQGQVWFLKVIDCLLYCGLNEGTFVFDGQSLQQVSSVNGGYDLRKIILNGRERMMQTTYNELIEYTLQSGIWKEWKRLGGWNAPVRTIEADQLGRLFLGHAVSGVFKAEPNIALDSIAHFELIDARYGLNYQASKVYNLDGRIVISGPEGFLQWDALNERFTPFSELNPALGVFANAINVVPATNHRYWLILNDQAALFEIRMGKAKMIYRLIFSQFELKLVRGYENIVPLSENNFLICLEDGFALLRIPLTPASLHQPRMHIQAEFATRKGETRFFDAYSGGSKIYVPFRFNSATFRFAIQGDAEPARMYQWKLDGIDENWHAWSARTTAEYSRLPYGNYTLRVRTHDELGFYSEESLILFRIRPPWFLSWYAYVAYALLSVIFVLLLQSNRRRRQLKLREKALREENERIRARNEQAEAELIRLSNERLQSEVVTKTMELAKNTMAMIRKNELLIDIREELANQKEQLGTRYPDKFHSRILKLIENGLNSEHDWEMFEHLFDQAHENFFRRLKESYPELTASDFRLCAYLRMNLSSKEIAPLLNISIRGVEEKRYRLRKKLNLRPEQNLTEFIIGF